MARRQREWAKRTRDKLHLTLGNKCTHCNSTKDLELDVIVAHDSTHHRKMEWSWRMSFYRKQLAANNLQLLCSKCNSKKGDSLVLHPIIDHPF